LVKGLKGYLKGEKAGAKVAKDAAEVVKDAEAAAKGAHTNCEMLRQTRSSARACQRTLERREGEHARGEDTKDLEFEVDRRT